MIKVYMSKKKETKGTYVYEEVNKDGSEREFAQCAVPSLYIRKTALSKVPEKLMLRIEIAE